MREKKNTMAAAKSSGSNRASGLPADYTGILTDLKARVRASQLRAAVSVKIVALPEGETRRGIERAFYVRQVESPQSAARTLGNGSGITCPDTVPFTVWSAAKYFGNFREAIAATASVGGDIDTNCAIVGGIVALSAGRKSIPDDWLLNVEKLPYPLSV
jgi:ADP-ribosylglycohydrolase